MMKKQEGEEEILYVSHGWKDFLQQTVQRAFGLILASPI